MSTFECKKNEDNLNIFGKAGGVVVTTYPSCVEICVDGVAKWRVDGPFRVDETGLNNYSISTKVYAPGADTCDCVRNPDSLKRTIDHERQHLKDYLDIVDSFNIPLLNRTFNSGEDCDSVRRDALFGLLDSLDALRDVPEESHHVSFIGFPIAEVQADCSEKVIDYYP